MIKISIDVSKIDESHLVPSNKHKDAKYLDILLIETPNSPHGNDYMAVQGVSAAKREAGERGPILGNARKVSRKSDMGDNPIQSPRPRKTAPQTPDDPY